MSVSAEQVKKLREISGAPMMECKKALDEAGGDEEKAFTVLRKRGQAVGGQEGGPCDFRRRRGELYPRGREDGCAGRSELRD